MKFVPTLRLALAAVLVFICIGPLVSRAHAAAVTDDTCRADRSRKFLGIIPVWYEYVEDYKKVPVATNDKGEPLSQLNSGTCGIVHADRTDAGVNLKNDAVAIGLAVIDILLRVGALAAVVFIMMGGYKYISSQGEPKNIEAAMATLINASIGLGLVVSATVLVAFIGHLLGG
jgi:hypothetical protein